MEKKKGKNFPKGLYRKKMIILADSGPGNRCRQCKRKGGSLHLKGTGAAGRTRNAKEGNLSNSQAGKRERWWKQ